MSYTARPRARTWRAVVGLTCVVASLLAAPAAGAGAQPAQEEGQPHITGVTPVPAQSVASGTSLEHALAQMPESTTITVSEGDPRPVELDWSLSETVETSRGGDTVAQEWFPTARGAYEMTGTFELPDGVAQADPPVALEVVATVGILSGPPVTLEDTTVFDQPGTYTADSLRFDTPDGPIDRTFQYYVPSSYDGTTALPLMVSLHGSGSYGLGQMSYSDFDRLAEEEGFIIVTPDYGTNAFGTFPTPGIADFTSAIIDHLSARYEVDARRIYASGISMGGGASQTLAFELSDRIAAVAPVASGLSRMLDEDLPRPMSVISFYGTDDSSWSPAFFDAIGRVGEQDGASATPEVTTWPATGDDPTAINRHAHTGGTYGTEAVFYQVEGGGHTWPGKYQYASLITVGRTSQHVDASELIWSHLSRQSLPVDVPVEVLQRRINPGSRGHTQVAVLSTDEVDATTIDAEVVRFGPGEARPERSRARDVDHDGRRDTVLTFETADLGIEPGQTSATLTAWAESGGALHGEGTFES